MSCHFCFVLGVFIFFFFFFQAEDGIRDWSVTGVQTVLFRSLSWPPQFPHCAPLESIHSRRCGRIKGLAGGLSYFLGRRAGTPLNMPSTLRSSYQRNAEDRKSVV